MSDNFFGFGSSNMYIPDTSQTFTHDPTPPYIPEPPAPYIPDPTTTAAPDPSQFDTYTPDPSTSFPDPTTYVPDPTTLGQDPSLNSFDFTPRPRSRDARHSVPVRWSGPSILGPDNSLSSFDFTPPGPDPATLDTASPFSGPDPSILGPDASILGPDNLLAPFDFATAAPDSAVPDTDSAVLGPDFSILGPDPSLLPDSNAALTVDDRVTDTTSRDSTDAQMSVVSSPTGDTTGLTASNGEPNVIQYGPGEQNDYGKTVYYFESGTVSGPPGNSVITNYERLPDGTLLAHQYFENEGYLVDHTYPITASPEPNTNPPQQSGSGGAGTTSGPSDMGGIPLVVGGGAAAGAADPFGGSSGAGNSGSSGTGSSTPAGTGTPIPGVEPDIVIEIPIVGAPVDSFDRGFKPADGDKAVRNYSRMVGKNPKEYHLGHEKDNVLLRPGEKTRGIPERKADNLQKSGQARAEAARRRAAAEEAGGKAWEKTNPAEFARPGEKEIYKMQAAKSAARAASRGRMQTATAALESLVGKLGVVAGVFGGILAVRTLAEDFVMLTTPGDPSLGPVGTHRVDSIGTVWIKITPDNWVTEDYLKEMA